MSVEPESLILQLLRDMRTEMGDMRAEIGDMRAEMVTKSDLRSELTSLRADVAADMIDLQRVIGGVRKDLSEHIVGLRRAVVEDNTSVIGHRIIISELEARLRRVEQHLNLPAPDAH